jgi:hypothetical protein
MPRRLQSGITTVEFAIVGLLLIIVFLVVIEFGRVLFTYNVLQEGARRGARVAAVCPVSDPAITEAALLLDLPGLTAANARTQYLAEDGAVLGDPAGEDYDDIRFVRVSIVEYDFDVFIPAPLLPTRLRAREFAVTLPRESLGVPFTGSGPIACG